VPNLLVILATTKTTNVQIIKFALAEDLNSSLELDLALAPVLLPLTMILINVWLKTVKEVRLTTQVRA